MHLLKHKNRRAIIALLTASIVLLSLGIGAHMTQSATTPRVVMIPGWHGDGSIFKVMIPVLEKAGLQVIDFDDSTPGTQAISHDASAPPGNLDIPALADQVEEMIKAKTNPGEVINIVAHSMGGLIARYMIEKGPSDPNIDDDWAARVDQLIMLGTPNHGTWEAYIGQLSPLFGDWAASAAQMIPGSSFLESLGYSEPAGERYITVGGDPWYLPGFDGVVPTDSPKLNGAEHYVVNGHHGELATLPSVIDLVIEQFGYTPQNEGESLPLVGTAFIRLEYFKMTGDHEWGTEEYYMDVYVDKDGGNDNYEYVHTFRYDDDGPFTWNPGNSGPNTATFAIPGTSPRMDVKIVLREDNDMINVFYYRDIMYSEDVDGVDYYSDTAADPTGSGNNEIRISVNGITSDIGQTVDVQVVLDRVRVDDDGDWGSAGENFFKVWAGSLGYELFYSWGTWSGEDVYWIEYTWQPGSTSDALIYSGRMVKTDTLRLRFELWDDDGIWGDEHLSGDLDVRYIAQNAAGYYSYDAGAAAWYYYITVT